MEKTMNKTDTKLIEAVKNVPFIAEKEQWVLTLDKEENSLFYSPEKIPNGAELYQVTDEYALYLDKNMKPQGLMIEYYGQNFVEHHKEFKGLDKKLFSGNEVIKTVDPKADNKKEVKMFKTLLMGTLMTEAANAMA